MLEWVKTIEGGPELEFVTKAGRFAIIVRQRKFGRYVEWIADIEGPGIDRSEQLSCKAIDEQLGDNIEQSESLGLAEHKLRKLLIEMQQDVSDAIKHMLLCKKDGVETC